MKKIILKRCPFCGSKAKFIKAGANYNSGVECKCCNIYFFKKGINVGFSGDKNQDGKNIAESWNKRYSGKLKK